ncbi:MAG: 4-(cytidine 5'-diphospho)-2-C-methyl-D-erythritol kinase [Lachnospiraceae bacterium]|nr:4-(cytidine 5'-diphospho)-2-C-methyl-D-erythritol kinase [Lachnospiraceae bacterium]
MSETLKIKAPAKINLTLDVTGRRPNGYHDLRMIMQTIDIYDEITITRIPANEIRLFMNRDLPDKIPPEKNLVWKAADLMKTHYAIEGGFDIFLEKNIPAAAGLAGGSSDCAATLIAISQLCKLNLTVEQLCELGVSLGADVPFCIQKGTMLSEGIGEILTRLPDLTPLWVLLIKPDISVSTGYVYTHLNLDNLTTHPDTEYMLDCISRRDDAGLAKGLSNVLETVTIPEYPVLAELKQFFLDEGAAGSLMSGSGPTTYGLYQDEILARMAFKKALARYPAYNIMLCRTKLPD